MLVGLSSGDTVALDLVSNCTVAGTRPNNVIALVRPDDVKEGTAGESATGDINSRRLGEVGAVGARTTPIKLLGAMSVPCMSEARGS